MDSDGVRHIGIQNCKRRLSAFFGDEASIDIKSVKAEGTSVEIKMPLVWENTDESVDSR